MSDRDALLDPIRRGLLPDRSRLAEVIAALSEGHASDIQDGIDAGIRYWRYNGRYWEAWWPGDLGTMAMDRGPASVDDAWDIVVGRGLVPQGWQDDRRRFCLRTCCVACRRTLAGVRCGCGCEARTIDEVAMAPPSVELCAMIACDPAGIERAEQLARQLAARPASLIAWRAVTRTELLRSLVDAELESQYPLLELGYALDPLATWRDGLVLALPALDE